MKTHFNTPEEKDENGHYKFVNVNEIVYNKIEKGILQCIAENRIIDWNKLKEYCLEYFELPDSVVLTELEKLEKIYFTDANSFKIETFIN